MAFLFYGIGHATAQDAATDQIIGDGSVLSTITVDEIENTEIEPSQINGVITEENLVEVGDSIEIIFPNYEPWDVASLAGKLKMQGLPLSPTLKIFMKRDSLISVSVRAPFMGEVGRLDLTPDTLLLANKMNKTFMKQSVGGLNSKTLPFGIDDIQDLLLARFFLPGFDVMEDDLEELTDITYSDGQVNVVPKGEAEIPGVKYAFAVDEYFTPLMILVMPEDNPEVEIDVVYDYKQKGYDIWFGGKFGSKAMEATLEMKDPEWKGDEPKPLDLRKYREAKIEQIFGY